MPTNSAIKGQKYLATFGPETYIVFTVEHSASNGSTFDVDAAADSIISAKSRGGTDPTASLGSASTGLKTVTLSGGTTGIVDVIVYYKTRPSTYQPPQSNSESG